MIPWLFILFVVGSIGAIGLWFAERKRHRGYLEALEGPLGLHLQPGTWGRAHRLVGSIEGYPVRVEGRPLRKRPFSPVCAHIIVEPKASPSPPLTLVSLSAQEHASHNTVETGDLAFDKAVRVVGLRRVALATLNKIGRAAAWEIVVTFQGQVVDGRVHCPVGAMSTHRDRFERVVTSAMELATALWVEPEEIPYRLLTNVREDLDPTVRLHNLNELFSEYPDAPETGTAMENARNDPDQRIRLASAKHRTPRDNREDMWTIAASAASDDVRLEALENWVRNTPADAIRERLLRLLEDPSPVIQCAAIQNISQLRIRSCADTLVDHMDGAEPPALRAIAEALGNIGHAASQPALLQLLKHTDGRVQLAALNALGCIGTPTVIERLKPYTKGAFTNESLRIAASRALEKIQSRLHESKGTAGSPRLIPSQPTSPPVELEHPSNVSP